MNNFEVPEPILNGPFDEPAAHWLIREKGTFIFSRAAIIDGWMRIACRKEECPLFCRGALDLAALDELDRLLAVWEWRASGWPVTGKVRCCMQGAAPGTGAPRGNRNARKHGAYSREVKELQAAAAAMCRRLARTIAMVKAARSR